MAVGHDEHRLAGAQALGGGADAALVDDGCGAAEERRVGRVFGDADGVGQGVAGAVALSEPMSRTARMPEALGGAGAEFIEAAGGEDGGGAEGEDERRWAGLEECFEMRRELALPASAS
jgi:hypothetical protein